MFVIKVQHFRETNYMKLCRGWMPPEFQIVVLDMTLEEQMERVHKRHAGDERMVEFAKV